MKRRRDSRTKNPTWTPYIFLAPLPLVLYFVYSTWVLPISPFYANYDPEFQYMLNSLEVFKGSEYYYADHPGAPVEVLGTLIYSALYSVQGLSLDRFVGFHLDHPGAFLGLAHGLMLLLSCVTLVGLVAFGARGRGSAAGVLGALVPFLYFVTHPLAFDALVLWSHNSFSFALGTLLLVLLYGLLPQASGASSIPTRRLAALGLAVGVFATFTIYLAAWIVAFVVIVVTWSALNRLRLQQAMGWLAILLVSSGAGLALGVFPLLHRLPYFMDWIAAVLTHSHPYLLTAADQPVMTQWAQSLTRLVGQLPMLFLVYLALAAIAVGTMISRRGHWRSDPASFSMLIGLLTASSVLLIAILDHAKPEFMLAVAALLPVLALVLVHLHLAYLTSHKALRVGLAICMVVGLVGSLASALIRHRDKSRGIAQAIHMTDALERVYANTQGRGMQSLVVVWTYGTYSPCFSLWFGNDSTDNAFRREIGRLCPRQLAYDYFAEMVIPRQGAMPLATRSWDIVFGCSEAFDKPELAALPGRQTFPELPLACGPLSVAYRQPQ